MIEMKDVSYQYEGSEKNTYSLRHVDLTVKTGECVVLCGRSGCGKTTLTRLVNGLIPHYYEGNLSGRVSVNGTEVRGQPLSKMARYVGSVFQNPRSQFFNVDTTGELAFGCENQGFPKEMVLDRIREAAERFALDGLMDRSIFELSGGEKQRIACASVYAVHPDIFVLDEPSANLDPVSIQQLKTILEGLKAEGKTLVVSEHRLYYLADIADRFIYLENETIKAEYTKKSLSELSPGQISAMGLRTLDLNRVDERAGEEGMNLIQKGERAGEEGMGLIQKGQADRKFEIRDLECKVNGRSVLKINFLQIPAGEIVAVIGHNGAGKSTLAGCFCGIRRHTGKVFLDGTQLKAKKRLKESYMVMQDVNHQLFTESVRDEVTLNVPRERIGEIGSVLGGMGLDGLWDRHPLTLSGGQKQRVAIASAICAGKKILIYDEPTSGLDYESMRSACVLIGQASQRADLSLVITHDLEFIMNCCTCVLHIDHGAVRAFYPLDIPGRTRLKNAFLSPLNGQEQMI